MRIEEIIHCVVLQKSYHQGMQNMNIRVQTRKSTKRVTNTQTEDLFQESYKGECMSSSVREGTPEQRFTAAGGCTMPGPRS